MSDRSLRRLVARLGDLGATDLGHVLASLTAAQRARVDGLLDERRCGAAAGESQPSGFAPGLAARLADTDVMARHARRVLQDCAALVSGAASPTPAASLLGRLGGLLGR